VERPAPPFTWMMPKTLAILALFVVELYRR
jgi:hypothetical protein